MTPRQRFFVLEYLIDLNGEQAAIRAGYAPSNARSQAARLMGYPEIAAAIRTEMAERAHRTGITPERVIAEYARIAFADMSDIAADWNADKVVYTPSAELSDEAAAIIAYIGELAGPEGHRLEVKTFDKRRALESLARIFGLNVASFVSLELGAHHA